MKNLLDVDYKVYTSQKFLILNSSFNKVGWDTDLHGLNGFSIQVVSDIDNAWFTT